MSRRSRPRAAHHVVARGRIRTDDDRLLLVRPVRRTSWYLPGGLVEHGEAPGAGCDREIEEELNLRSLVRGELLTNAWTVPFSPDARSWLTYLFDYGRHDARTLITNVRLPSNEIDDWALMTYDDALTALQPHQAEILHAAHTGVSYIEQHRYTDPARLRLVQEGP